MKAHVYKKYNTYKIEEIFPEEFLSHYNCKKNGIKSNIIPISYKLLFLLSFSYTFIYCS